MRSPVTSVINSFNALTEDEKKLCLDFIAPEPEPQPEAPAKKTRKKRAARSAHQESISAAIAKTPKVETGNGADEEKEDAGPLCGTCGNIEGYQDHHKPSPNYHPFESTAKPASKKSSRKGAVTNFTPNSETQTANAAVAAGGSNA